MDRGLKSSQTEKQICVLGLYEGGQGANRWVNGARPQQLRHLGPLAVSQPPPNIHTGFGMSKTFHLLAEAGMRL